MDERVARCMLIAKVLVADGLMADEEKVFLASAMELEGLSEAERERVQLLEGWTEAEALVATLPLAEKQAFMDRLTVAVLADRHISPHERTVIAHLAEALGLP